MSDIELANVKPKKGTYQDFLDSGIVIPKGLYVTVIEGNEMIPYIGNDGTIDKATRVPTEGTIDTLVTQKVGQKENLEGLWLNKYRTESEEMSKLLPVGWVTIAEGETINAATGIASFTVCSTSGRGLIFDVGIRPSGNNLDSAFHILKIKGRVSNSNSDSTFGGVRIAYSDTDGSAGFKVQIEVKTAGQAQILKTENIGRLGTYIGISLVEPTITDNDKCPDGSDAVFLTEHQTSGSQRVLWTGPLSIEGVTTSLNDKESFDDWDQIIIRCNSLSDTVIFQGGEQTLPSFAWNDNVVVDFSSQYGEIRVLRESSSTFKLAAKTVDSGNVSQIIGVKL